MKIISKFIMAVLAITLVFNQSSMLLANDEILSDEVIEETFEIDDEEVIVEEKITSEEEVLSEDIDSSISDLVSSEEELIAALSLASGDVEISFDVGEIILNSVVNIDSSKINSITFRSTVSDSVKLINNSGKKHIEVKGNKDITLNMYEVVLSGNSKSDGGIKAYDVNNININGLVIKDNMIKAKSWITSFVTVKAKGNVSFKDLVTDNNTIVEDSEQDTGLIRVEVVDGLVSFEDTDIKNTTIKTLIGNNISINGENNKVVLKNVSVNDSDVRQGSAGFSIFSRKDVEVTVDNVVLKNNATNVGNSGSLNFRSYSKVNLKMNNSLFEDNFSYRGGAALYVEGSKGMNVSVNDSVFNNNEAVRINYDEDTGETTGLPSNGGAIYLSTTGGTDSSFDILNSSFDNNYAGTGGAVSIYTKGTYIQTLIENTEFTNNSADYSSGALSYYFGNSSEVVGALTINDSSFISNVVTGKDNGPNYYRGGDGGAISIDEVRKFPNILKINDTTFSDNEAVVKNYWHYDKDSDGSLDSAYTDNILNTSYSSDTSLNNVKNRNNVFNGDDIHFSKTAYVVLDFSEDEYDDLLVNNYNTEKLVFFNAYTGTKFSELTKPTADGYTFVGWKDADGKMWNFDEHILADDMDKGQYHIKAVWAKTIESKSVITVRYLDSDLNEIMDTKRILGQVNEVYNIEVLDIDGYTFKHVLDNKSLSGTFDDSNIDITLIYEKDLYTEVIPNPDKDIDINDDIDSGEKVNNEDINEASKQINPNTGFNDLSLNYKIMLLVSAVVLGVIYYNLRKVKKI